MYRRLINDLILHQMQVTGLANKEDAVLFSNQAQRDFLFHIILLC